MKKTNLFGFLSEGRVPLPRLSIKWALSHGEDLSEKSAVVFAFDFLPSRLYPCQIPSPQTPQQHSLTVGERLVCYSLGMDCD